MTNMPLQTNTLNMPRNKDLAALALMQQQAAAYRIDPNALGIKKLDSPSINKDIPMSPSSEKLVASRRETEGKGDQNKSGAFAIENMLNQSSPAQFSTSVFQVE